MDWAEEQNAYEAGFQDGQLEGLRYAEECILDMHKSYNQTHSISEDVLKMIEDRKKQLEKQ